MIISLSSIENKKFLNILFLLIPVSFLLPVSFSNIFWTKNLKTIKSYPKKYDLNIKTDILDIILFFFFCIIITSSLIEIIIYNDSIRKNSSLDILDKVSIIRFFFIYWLTKKYFTTQSNKD